MWTSPKRAMSKKSTRAAASRLNATHALKLVWACVLIENMKVSALLAELIEIFQKLLIFRSLAVISRSLVVDRVNPSLRFLDHFPPFKFRVVLSLFFILRVIG